MAGHFRSIGFVVVMAACLRVPLAAQPASSGVDCANAVAAAEKMVCGDQTLSALDRSVADLYKAVEKDPASAARQKDLQSKWLAERNVCSQAADAHGCIQSSYQRRLVSLQIAAHKLAAPRTGQLTCGNGNPLLTASFYNDCTPMSALLKYGNDQALVLIEPSGSGARYGAPGFEYWEHEGEAAVTWRGKQMTCKVQR